MIVDLSVLLAWVLLIAIIPIGAVMLSRAWRIGMRRDYSRLALHGGKSPPDPQRWARSFLVLNLACALLMVAIFVTVIIGAAPFVQWSGAVGLVLWIYLSASHLMTRRAHQP